MKCFAVFPSPWWPGVAIFKNTGKTLETSLRKEAGESAGNLTVLSSLPLSPVMDDVNVEYVKDLVVTQRKTHSEVSLLLKEAYPGRRGLSLVR